MAAFNHIPKHREKNGEEFKKRHVPECCCQIRRTSVRKRFRRTQSHSYRSYFSVPHVQNAIEYRQRFLVCVSIVGKSSYVDLIAQPIYWRYYTVARRYEFYVRVARTTSHEWAQRLSEILFLDNFRGFLGEFSHHPHYLLYQLSTHTHRSLVAIRPHSAHNKLRWHL